MKREFEKIKFECLRMVSSEDDREENIGASEEFERDFNEGSEKEQKNVTI